MVITHDQPNLGFQTVLVEMGDERHPLPRWRVNAKGEKRSGLILSRDKGQTQFARGRGKH